MTDDALQAARAKFELMHPRLERAATATAEEIKDIADKAGIPVRTEGRAKDVDSFVKKALTRGYSDPWGETTDKAGARVIVAVATHLYELVEALELRWADREAGPREDKSLDLAEQVMDYSGVHLHVFVREEEDDTERIECEVQVRTAAQDAWSILSHDFLYKPIVPVEKATRRALWRLVAMVEIFDEEVERAVTTVLHDPDYPQARLQRDAERAFFKVVHRDYDHEMSALLFSVLVHAVPEVERATYGDALEDFLSSNKARVDALYTKFGPRGELGGLVRYATVTQPEALVLFERVENAAMLLADAVEEHGGADIKRLITPTLAAWGKPLPDLD